MDKVGWLSGFSKWHLEEELKRLSKTDRGLESLWLKHFGAQMGIKVVDEQGLEPVTYDRAIVNIGNNFNGGIS